MLDDTVLRDTVLRDTAPDDTAPDDTVLDDTVRQQDGLITRAQGLAGGLTQATIKAHLRSGRWQRIFVGVYATFSGPVPRGCLLWAVALRAGDGAVLSHETAAELIGLTDRPAGVVHVTVPARRATVRIPGVVVHRTRRAHLGQHPARTPSQTRVEETVVDLTQTSRTAEAAIAWLARAVGARLTTPARILDTMGQRTKLRWRRLLAAALRDVATGCHSLIEVLYLRDVERAHGLPAAARQVRTAPTGRSRYDDVRYRAYRTRVELDGRATHPEHDRWRDFRRDNEAVVDGDQVLRYGLGDVAERPCQVADQVGGVLTEQGWTGRPRRCGRAGCVIL